MKSSSSIFKNLTSLNNNLALSTNTKQHLAGYKSSNNPPPPHYDLNLSSKGTSNFNQSPSQKIISHAPCSVNHLPPTMSTNATNATAAPTSQSIPVHTSSCSNIGRQTGAYSHRDQSPQTQTSSDFNSRNENYLPSSSYLINKLGRTYLIGYLGSAILTKGKTGLGCLQQPLRELYCIFRQSNSRLIQERRLIVSIDGLTMVYNELGIEKCLHNDLSFVYDVELLQLVCEHKKDKKLHCAFLPIAKDVEVSTDNLFQKVDKHYVHLIENKPHPPIIALIMRRSTGIQVLECHVFICRSTNEAQVIVNEIRNACNKYKHEQGQNNNIFQYKPYTTDESQPSLPELKQLLPQQPISISHVEYQQQQQQYPIRIQDKVETKTVLSDPNYSLPPKSPFFKPARAKNNHHYHNQRPSGHTTTEKTYETCYIDEQSKKNSLINKSTVTIADKKKNTNNANLATKSSSHISDKSVATTSAASLFSKIKSNLKDRSLSKSNTNLNMQDQMDRNGTLSKNQRKSTFKQLKSKKAMSQQSAANTNESSPLSSSSSIAFGAKVDENKSRPLSSMSNHSHRHHHQNTPSPVYTLKSAAQAQPQSILVNGGGNKNHRKHSVNVFYDDDSLSTKSDILASTGGSTVKTSASTNNSSGRSKKAVRLGQRLLDSARSTLRSHSAHTFKNSLKNLVSKSETSINNSSNSSSQQQKSSKSIKLGSKSKARILDSNLLLDTNNIFDPVSVIYHHQPMAPQYQHHHSNHPQVVRHQYMNPSAAKCNPVQYQMQPQVALKPKNYQPRSNSMLQHQQQTCLACHKCAQPCSVQYVHQPPLPPPPPPIITAQNCQCQNGYLASAGPATASLSSISSSQHQTAVQSNQQFVKKSNVLCSPSTLYNANPISQQYQKLYNQSSTNMQQHQQQQRSLSSGPRNCEISNLSPSVKTTHHVRNHHNDENSNSNHYYHYSSKLYGNNTKNNNDDEYDHNYDAEVHKNTLSNAATFISPSRHDSNDKNIHVRESKFQKRVFKFPVADPKLFANHLVWNNEQKKAEPVLDSSSSPSKNSAADFSPIARAISPGCNNGQSVNVNTSNANTGIYSDLAEASSCNFNHSYNESKNIYSKAFESSSTRHHNAVANLEGESSNAGTASTPSITLRTSFSSRNKNNNNINNTQVTTVIKKELADNEYCLSTSADSCLNESFSNENEHNFESRKRTQNTQSGSKVVGGFKVFPNMPYDYQKAADFRRTRLSEIEEKLKEIEKNTNLRKQQKQSTSSQNSNEIIDLTNNNDSKTTTTSCKMDLNKILYESSSSMNATAVAAASHSSSNCRNIPIHIVNSSHQKESEMGNVMNDKVEKKLASKAASEERQYVVNDIVKKFSNSSTSTCANKQTFDEEPKPKLSAGGGKYVYYYDDSEHFGGY